MSPTVPGVGSVSTLNTPEGSPTSAIISASISAVRGVVGAGFSTIVLPATSAGAILITASHSGKFHGVMAATTP